MRLRNLLLLIGLLVGLVISSLGQVLGKEQDATCRLSGTVSDRTGAIAPGIRIVFRGTVTRQIESDQDGRFDLALPKGFYDIELFLGTSKLIYKRSGVDLDRFDKLNLNLIILPECVSFGCVRKGYNFITLPGGWLQSPKLGILIAYNSVIKSRSGRGYSEVVLTYGEFTIVADKLYRRGNLLTAQDGWIEDGNIKKEFQTLSISSADGPIFNTQQSK